MQQTTDQSVIFEGLLLGGEWIEGYTFLVKAGSRVASNRAAKTFYYSPAAVRPISKHLGGFHNALQ